MISPHDRFGKSVGSTNLRNQWRNHSAPDGGGFRQKLPEPPPLRITANASPQGAPAGNPRARSVATPGTPRRRSAGCRHHHLLGGVDRGHRRRASRIVGEDGSVLPAGGIGEVHVHGPNVMQGYLDDPELTAKTVVDGWLRTGDLGRLDDDGFLYIEGRLSEMIKCAGERIAPAEIEEVLMKHPGVSEAAVIAGPDPLMGRGRPRIRGAA